MFCFIRPKKPGFLSFLGLVGLVGLATTLGLVLVSFLGLTTTLGLVIPLGLGGLTVATLIFFLVSLTLIDFLTIVFFNSSLFTLIVPV